MFFYAILQIIRRVNMKKILSLFLIILLLIPTSAFAKDKKTELLPINSDFQEGIEIGATAKHWGKDEYIGFKNVDLTGINSITAKCAYVNLIGGSGETIRVRIDNPNTGDEISTIVICEEKEEYKAYLGGVTGVHDLYFVGSYWSGYPNDLQFSAFTLSSEVYDYDPYENQVDDSFIKDFYTDTWVATDSFGRRIAEYGEAGPVKEGDRYVGMMFWNWTKGAETTSAAIISDVLKEHPDAMTSDGASVWNMKKTYWDESVYGFYDSFDYWVYRRQAELLAAAGVDAIFLDYSNNGATRINMLMHMARAFRDAKKDGVDIPEISAFCGSWTGAADLVTLFSSIYNACFQQEDFSDIWFHWEGKPLIFGVPNVDGPKKQFSNDPQGKELMYIIEDFFSFRADDISGKRDASAWRWIEEFPQTARGNKQDDGRPEFMCLGVSVNKSYAGTVQAANDVYSRGRSYSEAFGDDYRTDAVKEAFFFREQASLVLDTDPHFVYVDGWNELASDLHRNYSGLDFAFPDAFDSDNSRDFEPVKGFLKDDCYNLLCDFVRKYKGVRPAPVASGEVTIDISGDVSQWDSVGPEFLNFRGQDRINGKDAYPDNRTGVFKTYNTEIANRVLSSKAARDSEFLYFYAKADKDIKYEDGTLQLLINTDRNTATGFDGYDYILGRKLGSVEKMSKGADGIAYEAAGTYEYNVSGDVITLKLSREIIGETGEIDMELKWLSGEYTEVVDFYSNLSTAPIGRFNYLYTEKEQKALSSDEKASCENASILKAGAEKMIVKGTIQTVSEKDIRITPFEMNGTLYIPLKAFEEITGWGKSKTEYDSAQNILRFYNYELNDEKTDFAENNWYYTYIGTNEVRKNGKVMTLSAPVIIANGEIFAPVTVFSDCMGRNIRSLGNGVYTIGNIEEDAAKALLSYIED